MKRGDNMTVFDFIHQMNREDLTGFIQILLMGCECGVCECPLVNFGKFDDKYFACTPERIADWLESECSEKQINDFLG